MGFDDYNDDLLDDIYDDEYLAHIGTPHEGTIPHSGRYEYGSGEHAFQRDHTLYAEIAKRKAKKMDWKDIALELGIVNRFGKPDEAQIKAKWSNAKAEHDAALHATVVRMHEEEGKGWTQIGRELGIGEQTVRHFYKAERGVRTSMTRNTANVLKEYVDKNRYIDISSGVNDYLGVTENRMKNAVELLKDDGYNVYSIKLDQAGTDHKTTYTVLTPPDCDYQELSDHRFDIRFPRQDTKVVDDAGNLVGIGLRHPTPIDPKRLQVVYNEEGGVLKDGLIELRPGVADLSLGSALYSQVRINVNDTHYLKGMAMYNPDLPPGIDVRFNTNKHIGTPLMSDNKNDEQVLKPMKRNKFTGEIDWSNPFGSSISPDGQMLIDDKNGNKVLSACNVVRFEGEWQEWKNSLAAQFLSKQPVKLAERQLKLTSDEKRAELEEIMNLTNPEVKKQLLISYADKCDALSYELKAAPFTGQQVNVLLPFPELGDNEAYAPNYKDGTRIALVRYPHQGTWEIAELTVKNTGSPAEKVLGKNVTDVVGINHNVADRLSGADFDGDFVITIPLNDKVRIRSIDQLEGLKGFDPKEVYHKIDGMKIMTEEQKGREMGIISNLITDMTIKGASEEHLTWATKHALTVIDAPKHQLNYKQSEIDNHIDELKKLYQTDPVTGKTGGSSTIISRAKSPILVPEKKDWYASSKSIGPNGEKIYENTGESFQKGTLKGIQLKNGEYVDVRKEKDSGRYYYTATDPNTSKNIRKYVTDDDFPDSIENLKKNRTVSINKDKKGKLFYLRTDPTTGKKVRVYAEESDFKSIKTIEKKDEIKKMEAFSDAYKLTSGGSKENPGYLIEAKYADFANDMKSYANQARQEWLKTPTYKRDPEMAKKYKNEVDSLNKKLKDAVMNRPLERQAQLLCNRHVALAKEENPGLSKDEIKKLKGRMIVTARGIVNAKKKRIVPTDAEWEAIQNKAISPTKLRTILENSDLDVIKEKATPRSTRTITPAMEALAKSMSSTGASLTQIADRLHISTTSVKNILKGG